MVGTKSKKGCPARPGLANHGEALLGREHVARVHASQQAVQAV